MKDLIFKRKEKEPRIAFREQRDGIRRYFVEIYDTYDGLDYYYMQNSSETTDIVEAEKMLKEITDKQIIRYGVI